MLVLMVFIFQKIITYNEHCRGNMILQKKESGVYLSMCIGVGHIPACGYTFKCMCLHRYIFIQHICAVRICLTTFMLYFMPH